MRNSAKWLVVLAVLLSVVSLVRYRQAVERRQVLVELISVVPATMPPTRKPTFQPTLQPTFQPTLQPTLQPTFQPTLQPTSQPTLQPTSQPTLTPIEIYTNKVRRVNEYMQCVTSPNGSWVPREHGLILPDWQYWTTFRFCPFIHQPITVTSTNRTGLFYTWRPPTTSYCSDLETFTRARFCQVLNGRMLYLMGDSIMVEFYENIRYLFGLHVLSESGMNTYNRVELACPLPFPNIILDLNRAHRLYSTVRNTTGVDNTTIFVVNKGAHFVNEPILLRDVRSALNSLLANYSNATIIWRTTAAAIDFRTFPGERPFTSVLPLLVPPILNLTTIDTRFPNYTNWEYSWHLFQEQNVAVKAMLDSEYPTVLQMDIFHLDSLRLDGRRDALHFCIPSARMEWVALLMNLLIQVAK
ncbi:hypothetical protein BASA81_005487 [Batrachochytrium salamandrivorans]|nr:hypothetical protein BASA81_005487 [Batrachochytrium salamandrivorans]